jgi:transposase InsO family protein
MTGNQSKKHLTTHSDPLAVRAPEPVNCNFTASNPDQLWVADFTYCSTWSGIVYISFITDVFSQVNVRSL